MSDIPSIFFLNIRISVIDAPGVLRAIEDLVAQPGCALVNNVNIHACNLACEQPAFRRILNESAVVFCDGYGVKWAARLRGLRLGARMTPPDWVDALFVLGARKGWSFFFVGDEAAVVEAFAAQARARHPGLAVAGTHHGFFQPGDAEDMALRARIRALRPDVIITGMGMPRQEYWADAIRPALDHGVIIAAGALFRWYTGIDRRAPRWMAAHGMEWLHRLLTRPVRNFRRYVVGIPVFLSRVVRSPKSEVR
jgi:N-acetylglucosaminyldiphosphoundecaprenol N-acetyl-beta-D-mannosaminyltransferase